MEIKFKKKPFHLPSLQHSLGGFNKSPAASNKDSGKGFNQYLSKAESSKVMVRPSPLSRLRYQMSKDHLAKSQPRVDQDAKPSQLDDLYELNAKPSISLVMAKNMKIQKRRVDQLKRGSVHSETDKPLTKNHIF